MTVQLVVGLQNPGEKYAGTRHNAGAWLVQALAQRFGISFKSEKKFFGALGSVRFEKQEVKFLLPDTYMNESGRAVAAVSGFFKIAPSQILVAHDELDLPPGTARLKAGGGLAGHNGLKDISRSLGGAKDYLRVRLGIGHPGLASEVIHYVLKKPSAIDQSLIYDAIHEVCGVFDDVALGRLERAMLRLHTKPAVPEPLEGKE